MVSNCGALGRFWKGTAVEWPNPIYAVDASFWQLHTEGTAEGSSSAALETRPSVDPSGCSGAGEECVDLRRVLLMDLL